MRYKACNLTSYIPVWYIVTVVLVRLLRVNAQTTRCFEQFSNRTFHIVTTAEQFGTISVSFFRSDSALQHCYHHWTAFVISIYLKLCSSPVIQILIFTFLASTYNDLTSGSCPQAVVPWSHDLPTLPYALLYFVVGTVAPNRHIWILDIYMPMIWIRQGIYSIFTNKKNPCTT